MASTSECSRQAKELKLLDGRSELELVTASPGGSEHGTASCSSHLSAQNASGGGATRIGECSGSASLEEQIERSKSHWSLLADEWEGMSDNDEVAEESNKQVFQTLQRHSTWGKFFGTFGYDTEVRKSMGELRVGEKFAEGGQAELFHAEVTWRNPNWNERDTERGIKWVGKVFKKGTFLRHLQHQLPHGLLQHHAELIEWFKVPKAMIRPRFYCHVEKGILLEDGRFAFLMAKADYDLRALIERNMRSRNGKECGPFSKEEAEVLMYKVALGVEWLHGRGIIHRDLKASNVLISEIKTRFSKWDCFVADYECSVGVVGTGFFRAPEILQACREGNVNQKQDVFSKAADVYSYGMTCYEILIGKLPFEGHASNDHDVVLQGGRPEVPKYVEGWTRKLLSRCWESNPRCRPRIGEIVDYIVANSKVVKVLDKKRKEQHGGNFRGDFRGIAHRSKKVMKVLGIRKL